MVNFNQRLIMIEKIRWEDVSSSIIDIRDPFSIHDIHAKSPYEKDSRNQIIKIIIDLRKIFAAVNTTPKMYIIKDIEEGLPKLSYCYKSTAKEKLELILMTGGNEKRSNAWSIYKTFYILFDYDDMRFYSMNPRSFTHFRGYDLQPVKTVSLKLIAPFLDHILDVICAGDEDLYDYINKWIASIIQIPNIKLETALVIIGTQGTGKNLFTNTLCNLIDRYAVKNISDLDHIIGTYNAVIQNKKLVVCNELESILSRKSRNMDRLKTVITEKTIRINEKYIKHYTCDNVANFIFISNNPVPILIEDNDRRFVVTETSNEVVGNTKYFKKLGKLVEEREGDFYNHLFTYYLTKSIADFDHRSIPVTEAKEFIKKMSQPPEVQFIHENFRRIRNVRGPVLHEMWKEYARSIGVKAGSRNEFLAKVHPFTGESQINYIADIKMSQRVYNILPEVFEKLDEQFPI